MESSTESSSNVLDESSYSVLYSAFSPNSPVYSSNNETDLGGGVTLGMLKFCLQGVGVTTMTVLGVIGNIFTIVVLSSPKMRNTSSCNFLLCLAICDIASLVGATLLVGIPSLLIYHPTDSSEHGFRLFTFNAHIVQYSNTMPLSVFFGLTITAITASIYFIMALTLERYLAVCKPFYARYLSTWGRTSFVSLAIIVVTTLYTLPRWWEFTYVEETINNMTMYRPVPTAFRVNPIYDTYYVHASYVVLIFFIPIVFLIVFNILIYKQIKNSNRLRKNLSPMQKYENSLTRMLFGVVAVFLVCQISPIGHLLYRFANDSRTFVPEAEIFWSFLLVLNSSVNFIIYCATGGKFREVFCEIFCCRQTGSKARRLTASTTLRSLSSSSNSRSRKFSLYNSHHGRNAAPTASNQAGTAAIINPDTAPTIV